MATQTAKRDPNRIPSLLGVDSIAFIETTTAAVNPSTHALLVEGSFSPSGTQDVNLTKVGGSTITLGQTTMSASIPVTIASNQTALPVTLASTTITGTVAVTQSTSPWVTSASQSGTWNINNISGTISLPTGASTLTEQQTQTTALGNLLTTTAFQARINTLGQKTMANSTPIVIASDQTAIPVTVSSGSITVTQGTSPWVISGAVTNTVLSVVGGGAEATAQRVTIANDSTGVLTVKQATGSNLHMVVDSGTITTVSTVTAMGTGTTGPMKAEDVAHATGDQGFPAWGVRNDNGATTYGADQDYYPLAVDASGRTLITQKSPTGTLTSVASSATSVTVLAANSARLGATIVNESTQTLYVKFGATASATSYTVILVGASAAPYAYYEVPFGYSGRIDGIWASTNGNARVTEIT